MLVWLLVGLASLSSAYRVDPETTLFVDAYGRYRIFHGVNVVYKTKPFYPDLNEFSSNYSLTDVDLQNLRGWGFNTIRLHVAWEGVEPERGVYNYTYIRKLVEVVRKCNKFGVDVLLDAHQDLMSQKFCGEGFPDWAVTRKTFPFPVRVDMRFDENGYPLREDCLKVEFALFYLSADVMQLQQDFFSNKNGILDHFIGMWERVAAYMSQEPNVIGYEILNEPIGANSYRDPAGAFLPGVSNNKNLKPAYERVYAAIRKVDPIKLIFYEPSIFDPFGGGFNEPLGGSEIEKQRQVFSYHVYCPYVTPLGEPVST